MATKPENKLEDVLHAGTDAAAKAVHSAVDQVVQGVDLAEQNLRKSADVAQEKLTDSWHVAKDKSVAAKKSVNTFVQRHPLASLGIAVGVGMVLAMRSKRREPPVSQHAN